MLMKLGLKALTPIQMAAIRISVCGIVFLPFVYRHFKKLDKPDRKFVLIAGIIGNGTPAFLFAIAQTHVNSSVAGALNATTPMFTLLIGAIFTSMVISKSKILGVIIGLVGALAIVLGKVVHNAWQGGGDAISMNGDVSYSLLIVLATVLYGANINIIKTKLSHYKATIISTLPLFFISIPGIIIVLSLDWSNLDHVSSKQITQSLAAVIVLGLVGTSFALYLFNRLIQLSGPVFASSVTYFIPFVALILGIFDGEKVLLVQIAGMVLILTGVHLLNKART